jgi:hypothetical protein
VAKERRRESERDRQQEQDRVGVLASLLKHFRRVVA